MSAGSGSGAFPPTTQPTTRARKHALEAARPVSTEARQKSPGPRRSFLWSLNETSGEILMHAGPTEFTPSANDRIVRSTDRGGFEQAPMEARPFVLARDGEYVVLSNPAIGHPADEAAKNSAFIA